MAIAAGDMDTFADIAPLANEGVTSFKVFLAYRGELMVTDDVFLQGPGRGTAGLLDDEWARARTFLRAHRRAAGGIQIDGAGNLWAGLLGSRPGAIVVGSRLDCAKRSYSAARAASMPVLQTRTIIMVTCCWTVLNGQTTYIVTAG